MKFGFVTVAAAAFASALSFSAPASAAVDKLLTVNVYELCNTAGTLCAGSGPAGNSYFASETNDIWSQAGIAVNFNYKSKLYYDELYDLSENLYTVGYLDTIPEWDTPGTLTMFVVNSFNASPNSISYGGASGGALAIAMTSVMSFNDGAGRVDTIAHELGHNLGLLPPSLGGDPGGHSSVFYELMASADIRCVPGAPCASTVPGDKRLDFLTPEQITLARQSSLLQNIAPVPEPGEWAMIAAGLGIVGFAARRRRAA